MTRDDLLRFICEDAGLDPADIDETTPLFSSGLIDSFTVTSLIAYIEDETGAEIEQSSVTLENFDTVAGMMRFLETRDAD